MNKVRDLPRSAARIVGADTSGALGGWLLIAAVGAFVWLFQFLIA